MQTIATVPIMLAVALSCNALIVAGELSPSQREPAKHYRFIYNRDGCNRFWWVPSAGRDLKDWRFGTSMCPSASGTHRCRNVL